MIDRFLTRIANAHSFLSKLWVLSKPYWFAEERQPIRLFGRTVLVKESWIARTLLALIVTLSVLAVYMSKLINSWNARFFNALQDKNADAFWYELQYWVILVALLIVAIVYRLWLQQMLTIRWRRWLSEVYFRDWLADRTYYRMELVSQGTDNPEQRIEADCANFAERTLSISLGLLLQVMTLVTFSIVLWELSGSFVLPILGGLAIPGYMMWAAVLYAVVGSIATYMIGRPLVRVNFNLERYNADFRYRMVRIRENAESIALYRGETDEERRLRSAFGRIYDTWWDLMRYTKRLSWLTSFYGQAASIFPFIVAAPQYFAGKIQLGVLTQTADAFAQVQSALSWFVDTYPRLAEWKAGVDRLTTFSEAMVSAKQAGGRDGLRGEPPAGAGADPARGRGAAAERHAAAEGRRSHHPPGRIRAAARPVGQRQDHALPRARWAVAVRQGAHRPAARCPRAVPAAEALSADRHATGGAELSGGARPLHRRGLPRGAGGLPARPPRAAARGLRPTGRWRYLAASSSAWPSPAPCSTGRPGCSSTRRARRSTSRPSGACTSCCPSGCPVPPSSASPTGRPSRRCTTGSW